MSAAAKRKRPRRVTHRASPTPPSDQVVSDVLTYLGQVILGSGYTLEQLNAFARRSWGALPAQRSTRDTANLHYYRDASHVLTHWHLDAAFVDKKGHPLALPLRGAGATLESLIKQVNPKLDLALTVQHLKRRGAIQRRDNAWCPVMRRISYAGDRVAIHRRSLLILEGMLRAVAHNAGKDARTPGRYESLAENAFIPLPAIEALNQQVSRSGRDFLRRLDDDMRRHEVSGTDNTPRRRVGVGIYLFEAPSPHSDSTPRRLPRRTRSAKRPARR